jgi:general L-amino acid transport system substrate-binding protein
MKFAPARILAALSIAACGLAQAAPGETLAQVRARDTLRCGVSEGIAGFSVKDAAGRWSGLDIDFCRAVAAAALGDAGKATFVPLAASARFPALKSGGVDLLSRNTTWTVGREAGLKLMFAGVLLYDGQAFMVPAKGGARTLAALKGATVCVEKGTTSAQNLAEFSLARGLGIQPLVIDSVVGVADAFFAGKCRALTSDASQLAAARLRAPAGPQAFTILSERISQEPVGPVVRQGDDDWFILVRWVLFALVNAEESGITRDSLGKRLRDPAVLRALGANEELGKALGTDAGWSVRAVQSAGNYDEMFERNIGHGSPLKLERGLNNLWSRGGLMYAPPMR